MAAFARISAVPAQLDRFLLRLRLGYPSIEEERTILRRFRSEQPLQALEPVVEAEEVLALQQTVQRVVVTEAVETYLLALARATRSQQNIELGASPRAALALEHASQALAAIEGRTFVRPDEVKRMAPAVLGHRLMLSAQARLRGRSTEQVLAEVVASVPVPVEDFLLTGTGTADARQTHMAHQGQG